MWPVPVGCPPKLSPFSSRLSIFDTFYISTWSRNGTAESFGLGLAVIVQTYFPRGAGVVVLYKLLLDPALIIPSMGRITNFSYGLKVRATVKLGAQIVCKGIKSASLIIVHLFPGRNLLQFRAVNLVDFPRQAFFSPFLGNNVTLLNFATVRIFGRASANCRRVPTHFRISVSFRPAVGEFLFIACKSFYQIYSTLRDLSIHRCSSLRMKKIWPGRLSAITPAMIYFGFLPVLQMEQDNPE